MAVLNLQTVSHHDIIFFVLYFQVSGNFAVFYPDWIRIQSGQWIRIRIWDPDPGGQKCPTKIEKNFWNFMF